MVTAESAVAVDAAGDVAAVGAVAVDSADDENDDQQYNRNRKNYREKNRCGHSFSPKLRVLTLFFTIVFF